jgi:murein DD-endopeptidase MepM/ murein hydrolase activator NlpD
MLALAQQLQPDAAALTAALPRLARHALVGVLVLLVLLGELAFSWSRQAALPPAALDKTARVSGGSASAAMMSSSVPYEVPFSLALTDVREVRDTSPPPSVSISSSSEPLAAPLRRPEAVLTPAFQATHTLVEGESLQQLAMQYDVSPESLIWANNLYQGDILAVGQELRIPRVSGVPHVLRAGETLDMLAQHYGVPAELIIAFKDNGLSADGPLPVGREIFIPGGQAPLPSALLQRRGSVAGFAAMAAQPAGIVLAERTNMRAGPDTVYARVGQVGAGRRAQLLARHAGWLKIDVAGTTGWIRADLLHLPPGMPEALPETNDFPPPPPVWVWPAYGRFTSGFGPRWGSFHNGIDIANNAWTPIVAARTGVVIESGWCSGYGYCVKMQHPGGIQTIYGHLVASPPVSTGESVRVGEVIGYMGSTYDVAGGGYSTGNHLHFTILVNGRAVNPLHFLP